MKKLLLLGLLAVAAVVGCSNTPAPAPPPAPAPAPVENATHQVCITLGSDSAYCVRSERTPNGTTKYELITK